MYDIYVYLFERGSFFFFLGGGGRLSFKKSSVWAYYYPQLLIVDIHVMTR